MVIAVFMQAMEMLGEIAYFFLVDSCLFFFFFICFGIFLGLSTADSEMDLSEIKVPVGMGSLAWVGIKIWTFFIKSQDLTLS